MQIGIIGGGAIGLLVASYFHRHNHVVTLLTKTEEQAKLINQSGINLTVNELRSQIDVRAKTLSLNIDQYDLLIVCVKQYHLESIAPTIERYKGDNILFLQNGMSHIEFVENLKTPNCFIGIVEHGALKTSPNEINHTGLGVIKLGQVKGNQKSIDHIIGLHKKDFPLQFENNWLYILQQKCLVNCTINPLTAIFQIKNGELITNDYFNQISKLLCKEVSAVLGLELESEWTKIKEICKKTSSNYSSMNRDLYYKRETEIDSMLGFIKKKAFQKKIDVPTIELVYNMIKGLEKKKG